MWSQISFCNYIYTAFNHCTTAIQHYKMFFAFFIPFLSFQPFPCHHLPLSSPSVPLISIYLSVSLRHHSSYDCLPYLSSFLNDSPHLSLFTTLPASPPFSPVSSLLLFLSLTGPLILPVYSHSPLPHFHPFFSLPFQILSPYSPFLSFSPSSRS